MQSARGTCSEIGGSSAVVHAAYTPAQIVVKVLMHNVIQVCYLLNGAPSSNAVW